MATFTIASTSRAISSAGAYSSFRSSLVPGPPELGASESPDELNPFAERGVAPGRAVEHEVGPIPAEPVVHLLPHERVLEVIEPTLRVALEAPLSEPQVLDAELFEVLAVRERRPEHVVLHEVVGHGEERVALVEERFEPAKHPHRIVQVDGFDPRPEERDHGVLPPVRDRPVGRRARRCRPRAFQDLLARELLLVALDQELSIVAVEAGQPMKMWPRSRAG